MRTYNELEGGLEGGDVARDETGVPRSETVESESVGCWVAVPESETAENGNAEGILVLESGGENTRPGAVLEVLGSLVRTTRLDQFHPNLPGVQALTKENGVTECWWMNRTCATTALLRELRN